MELSNSNIKKFLKFLETRAPEKFLIFSQKKACLIFRETETRKKFVILQEIELSYVSGNGSPKKHFIFKEVTFQDQKVKKLLIFHKLTCKS